MKTKVCCKAPNLKPTKKMAVILSVILAVILAAGIVVCAVFGFNSSIKAVKTITVSVDYYSYQVEGDNIKNTVNEVLSGVGLETEDMNIGEKGLSGTEVVYVFDKDTSIDTLRGIKDVLDEKLALDFEDAIFSVSVEDVQPIGMTAKNYVGRGLIAMLIFAVASFLYVWIRYKLFAALYTLGGNLISIGLTTAIIALCRIPVMPSVAVAIAASVFFSTVTCLMFFNKLRMAQKEDSAESKSAEEIISASIAWKETILFATALCLAFVVMICVGKVAIAWFSLSAIVALAVATFIGLLYLPIMFVPAKKCSDHLTVKRAMSYKGAKKGEKTKKSNDEENVD